MAQKIVAQYMSPVPITIAYDQPIADAHRLMRDNGIRHLPVLRRGKVAGVVSERDLYFIDRFDPESMNVSEAMTAPPLIVAPTDTLLDVALQMAASRYGSAVVVEAGKVVGIFTTIDALLALADIVRSVPQPAVEAVAQV